MRAEGIGALYRRRVEVQGEWQPLGGAARPFAAYLNRMHRKLHPVFSDGFLASVDRLPASHPLNDPSLMVTLELVIAGTDGRLVRRGIIRSSGVTAFDLSAVASVDRAAPFGAAPPDIVSPDGNVYVDWDFRRDQMACSTMHARPHLLAPR
jgi:TonB family protein